MSFNRDIQLDPNRVQTRSGGGRGAVIGGGSILTVIAVVLISVASMTLLVWVFGL